jgi:glycosyltransferase involved in cell wall biosynthesis
MPEVAAATRTSFFSPARCIVGWSHARLNRRFALFRHLCAANFTDLIFIFYFSSGLLFVQLVYWFIFYFSLGRTKGDKREASVGLPGIPISIIVCGHDEEPNLRELIPLLQSQSHPEFEIIIVDDRSNDGTYDLLLDETKKDPRLKMVHITHKPEHINGKKYAITLGIKASKYETVLFTDADCRPASPEWATQMADAFTDHTDFVLGYSAYLSRPGLLNAFIRFETIVTAIQYLSFALIGRPYMGVGRNLAYKKKMFLDSKGFNGYISLAGGDDDLFVNHHATAQNTSIALDRKSLVYSVPKTTRKDFMQQKLRHLAVGKYYSFKSKLLVAPFGLSWVLFWPSVSALFFLNLWQFGVGTVLLKWIVEVIVVARFSRKAGEKFSVWWIPILDFIFCFYYLVTGFRALVTKRIKWKT